ncbi:plasminogen-like [Lytechinus variegatus]|uniref:plasminogen-like n=1 Tax=Lytechinus variegatus TaxID=7654 RepID=UPI001BB1AFF8|nr:plasminogen-like [Lytechinus variegatus]
MSKAEAVLFLLWWLFGGPCTDDANGVNYRGDLSVTLSGKTCLPWTFHEKRATPTNYPDRGLGDHNHCRNPDDSFTAWCYVSETDGQWEYCAIGDFSPSCNTDPGCYKYTSGKDYRGNVSITRNGRECQAWTSQKLFRHWSTPEKYPNAGLGDHNYCRNPGNEHFAWCFTADVTTRWEFCNIGLPSFDEEC